MVCYHIMQCSIKNTKTVKPQRGYIMKFYEKPIFLNGRKLAYLSETTSPVTPRFGGLGGKRGLRGPRSIQLKFKKHVFQN